MIQEIRWALRNSDGIFVTLGQNVALYYTKEEALQAAARGEVPIIVRVEIEEVEW